MCVGGGGSTSFAAYINHGIREPQQTAIKHGNASFTGVRALDKCCKTTHEYLKEEARGEGALWYCFGGLLPLVIGHTVLWARILCISAAQKGIEVSLFGLLQGVFRALDIYLVGK